MSTVLRTSTLVVACCMLPCIAFAQDPAKVNDGMFTNTSGMTLYTFDKDAGDKSACSGACSNVWPPLSAAADAKASGDWKIISRDDGSKQWTYKGKPVYTYSKDSKAGDKNGEGVGGVWHVAKP